MKYLRQFSLFVLSLVMFVGIFSTTAHAEELNNLDISVNTKLFSSVYNETYFNKSYIYDGSPVECISGSVPTNYGTEVSLALTVGNPDGSVLVKKGQNFNFRIDNIYYEINAQNGNVGASKQWDNKSITSMSVALVHTDGSYTYLYDGIDWNYTAGNLTHNISIDITAKKDIRKIIFTEVVGVVYLLGDSILNQWLTFDCYIGGANVMISSVDIESKEVGLLENIKGGISNLIDGIKNLPQKIWEVVSEGLKSLFVPSDEYVENWINEQKAKSEEKLGALYEVTFIMTESWEQIKLADSTDTITLPETTINFGDTPFTFGGYEVKIVPDGFEVLVNAVKLIIGIVCSAAFINGIRNRYEEVMGVEK